MTFTTELTLIDRYGQRKYLNEQERNTFYNCAETFPKEVRLFCLMIFFTGARISEIVNLNVSSIDYSNKTVTIQTLKRRKKGIYRQIPLPDFLLNGLKNYIRTREAHNVYSQDRLWFFSIRTASRYIKAVMHKAGIEGHRASSRGLRHGFAAHAVMNVPITQVQKWLGHSSLQTTAIYARVSGKEERELAKKLW